MKCIELRTGVAAASLPSAPRHRSACGQACSAFGAGCRRKFKSPQYNHTFRNNLVVTVSGARIASSLESTNEPPVVVAVDEAIDTGRGEAGLLPGGKLLIAIVLRLWFSIGPTPYITSKSDLSPMYRNFSQQTKLADYSG